MSLFKCSKCGCVENTAMCNFWMRGDTDPLCSLCDPEIGEWHGAFERRVSDAAVDKNWLYFDQMAYSSGKPFAVQT